MGQRHRQFNDDLKKVDAFFNEILEGNSDAFVYSEDSCVLNGTHSKTKTDYFKHLRQGTNNICVNRRARRLCRSCCSPRRAHSRSNREANQPRAEDRRRLPDEKLTQTENCIAVARGLTNKEIAAEMEISVRAVENHVSHILDKKHFHNRVEIARYVM